MDLTEAALEELLAQLSQVKLGIHPSHIVCTPEDLRRYWRHYVRRFSPSVQERLVRLNPDTGPSNGARPRGLPVNSSFDGVDRWELNCITLAEFKRRYGHTNVRFYKQGRRKYVTLTDVAEYGGI